MSEQSAQQAEAADTPVTVEWRDKSWTAPSPKNWAWDVLEAIDDEKYTHALRGLLDDDQYSVFKKLKPKPTISDGGELLDALAKGAGFDGSGE